jgi:hypothetical protein
MHAREAIHTPMDVALLLAMVLGGGKVGIVYGECAGTGKMLLADASSMRGQGPEVVPPGLGGRRGGAVGAGGKGPA